MAENITTLLDMTDAENISGDDYLYLVQGSGSKRDRKVRLGDIFASMEGWKRFAQYGETQNFELGEWDGDSVIMARPLISNHSSVYPSSVTVSQSQVSGISIVVAELTDDGSCTLTYGSETATLHKGEIAILYSFAAVGNAIFRISVIPSAAFGIFEKLKVIGETILPGATFTPATSSGGVPVAKFAYLKVLESLDGEKGMTVKGEAEFESVKADSLEVEKAKVSDMETSKISSPKTTLTVAAVLDALGVKGNVTTDMIVPKTAGQPISVIGSLSISGNVSLTGETAAVSAKSVATERLAYSKLSLKDAGFAKAPALPYFIDDSYSYDGDLSRQCSEAPEGGRVTFVNATGSERNYHFTGGANGKSGYFTLKNGHAVDLLVLETTSSTQVALVPIGINFSTVD